MKIIKLLLITNLLFLPFNSYADPFDAFKEIAKELEKLLIFITTTDRIL